MDSSKLTILLKAMATLAAICISAAALVHTMTAFTVERNARLVEIGIGVLRADPAKEGQIPAARGWALNLIEANAGGVRFSQQARSELLKNKFGYVSAPDFISTYTPDYKSTYTPDLPSRPK
jgi:hypothetical protein